LQEFYVTVTQKVSRPLSSTVAAQVISDLGAWQVHKPTVEDVLSAIQLQIRYRTSFWDAMILHGAVRLNCQLLWSEDFNPGQIYQQVRVENPFVSWLV
jgi:predicted nucleic acid-binding protein